MEGIHSMELRKLAGQVGSVVYETQKAAYKTPQVAYETPQAYRYSS